MRFLSGVRKTPVLPSVFCEGSTAAFGASENVREETHVLTEEDD